MPVALRINGFTVTIFLPPREHGPAHVHCFKADGEVVITLDGKATVRDYWHLTRAEVRTARELVIDNEDLLLTHWRKHHG